MKLTLREWRKAKGVPVAKLAEALGVDYSTVVRWEQGSKMPVGMAIKSCEYIGIDINDVDFFGSKSNKNVANQETA